MFAFLTRKQAMLNLRKATVHIYQYTVITINLTAFLSFWPLYCTGIEHFKRYYKFLNEKYALKKMKHLGNKGRHLSIFRHFNVSSEKFWIFAVGKDKGFEFYRTIFELRPPTQQMP